MLTKVIQNVDKLKFLVKDNSPAILTGVGVGGTIATAYLTGRASFKAAELLEQEKPEVEEDSIYLTPNLTLVQKVKIVWRLYIPPVGAGITTIASIIAANRISSKRMAALVVATGISERAFQEYKEKVLEKLGNRQEEKIRDELAQDRVRKHPVGSNEVIVTGTGNVLCYDQHTGRYFESSVEDIKRAENKVNFQLVHHMNASASEFYDAIGLPPTSYTDSVGWNSENRIEVTFSTVMSSDDRPCIAIDFVRHPTMEYARLYD
jgi:Family of unknown function (DUF6353)